MQNEDLTMYSEEPIEFIRKHNDLVDLFFDKRIISNNLVLTICGWRNIGSNAKARNTDKLLSILMH